MLCATTEKELEKIKVEIIQKGGKAEYVAGSLLDASTISTLFENMLKFFGPPDYIINNAAMIQVTPLIDLTLEEWDKTFNLNVKVPFLISQKAFQLFKEHNIKGNIVNVASIAGVFGKEKFPGFAAYSASKSALISLTECLAAEGKELGARVNCVSPGAVDTKMLTIAAPGLTPQMTPEEIANVIYFLCWNGSRPINGKNIEIWD